MKILSIQSTEKLAITAAVAVNSAVFPAGGTVRIFADVPVHVNTGTQATQLDMPIPANTVELVSVAVNGAVSIIVDTGGAAGTAYVTLVNCA